MNNINIINVSDIISNKNIKHILNILYNSLELNSQYFVERDTLLLYLKNIFKVFINDKEYLHKLILLFINKIIFELNHEHIIFNEDIIIEDNELKNDISIKNNNINLDKYYKEDEYVQYINEKYFNYLFINIIVLFIKEINCENIIVLMTLLINRAFNIKYYEFRSDNNKILSNDVNVNYYLISNKLYVEELNVTNLLDNINNKFYHLELKENIIPMGLNKIYNDITDIKNNYFTDDIDDNIKRYIFENNNFTVNFILRSNDKIIYLNDYIYINFNFQLICDKTGLSKYFLINKNDNLIDIKYDIIDKLNRDFSNNINNNYIDTKDINNLLSDFYKNNKIINKHKTFKSNNFNIKFNNKNDTIVHDNNSNILDKTLKTQETITEIKKEYTEHEINSEIELSKSLINNKSLSKEEEINPNKENNLSEKEPSEEIIKFEDKSVILANIKFECEPNNKTESNTYYDGINLNEFKFDTDGNDLINNPLLKFGNNSSYKILLYGKPKSGKTEIGKLLSKALNIKFITKSLVINNLFKEYNEKEESAETDDDGNKIIDMDSKKINIIENIKKGFKVKRKDIIYLFEKEIFTTYSDNFGYILEAPFYDDYGDLVKSLTERPELTFTHTINLHLNTAASCNRFTNIYEYIDTNKEEEEEDNAIKDKFYDDKAINELLKLKEKGKWMTSDDYDNNLEDEEAPDLENIPELKKGVNLFKTSLSSNTRFTITLNNYQKYLRHYIRNYNHRLNIKKHIKIDVEGMNIKEVVKALLLKLNLSMKVLYPKVIEGCSDFQGLYSYEKNIDQFEANNRLSFYKNIDCVEFIDKNNYIFGNPEFAAEFMGFVFVFKSEDNVKIFMDNPKRYLKKEPKLENQLNISITGSINSGKKSIAKELSDIYNWKIIDFEEYLKPIYKKELESYIEGKEFVKNDLNNNTVKLSKNDFLKLYNGEGFEAINILPFILNEFNVPLKKKEDKKKLNEIPQPNNKEKGLKGKNKDKKIPEIEDIELCDIVPIYYTPEEKDDEEVNSKADKSVNSDKNISNKSLNVDNNLENNKIIYKKEDFNVKGLIFINFPTSENQINKLNDFGINIDRVILLKENEDEGFGNVISKRPLFDEHCNLAEEQQFFDNIRTLFTEKFNEEVFYEVEISDNKELVLETVRSKIDVFYNLYDEKLFKNNGDLNNDEETVNFGKYGIYCPISMVDNNVVVKGNKDYETQIDGELYLFYNEDFKNKFLGNIHYYLQQFDNIKRDYIKRFTRIFVTGCSGSGVKTNIKKLQDRLRLPVLNFKEEFFRILTERKNRRKMEKYYNEPFKAPEFDDEGNEIEEEFVEDPEFDQKNEQLEIARFIINGLNSCIININFILNESESELFDGSLFEILQELGFIPEFILTLKCSESAAIKRLFNEDDFLSEIREKNNIILTKRKELYDRKYNELLKERQDKIDSGELEINENEEEEPIEINEDELYEELDPLIDENEKLEEEKSKYKEKWNSQIENIDDLCNNLEEVGVKIYNIDSVNSLNKVFDKIQYSVSDALKYRKSMFDIDNIWEIKDSEGNEDLLFEDKVINIMKNNNYYKFIQWDSSIFKPYRKLNNINSAIIYKDNLLFLENKNDIDNIKKDISIIDNVKQLNIDQRVLRPNNIFVIGNYKTGKTLFSEELADRFGLVYLNIKEIIKFLLFNYDYKRDFKKEFEQQDLEFFKYNDYNIDLFKNNDIIYNNIFDNKFRVLKSKIENGDELSDSDIIYLVKKRVSYSDVLERGFVLDGFPQSIEQSKLLVKSKIIPDIVLEYKTDNYYDNILNNISINKNRFSDDTDIINIRITTSNSKLKLIRSYFKNKYNNFYFLDYNLSVLSNYLFIKKIYNKSLKNKLSLCLNLRENKPIIIEKLLIDDKFINNNLSLFGYYDAVQFKINRTFDICHNFNRENVILYNSKFYYFKNKNNMNLFIKSPTFFNNEIEFYQFIKPTITKDTYDISYRGFDPIDIYNKKYSKGYSYLSLCYKNKCYYFNNIKNLNIFFKNPYLYSNLKMDYKIPLQYLETIQKEDNSYSNQAYFEKNIQPILLECFNEINNINLTYPFISKKESYLKIFSLLLNIKNNNLSNEIKESYDNKLKMFINHCKTGNELFEKYNKLKSNNNKYEEDDLYQDVIAFKQLYNKIISTNKRDYFEYFNN